MKIIRFGPSSLLILVGGAMVAAQGSPAYGNPVSAAAGSMPDIQIDEDVAGNLKKESTPSPTRPKVGGNSGASSSEALAGAFSFGRLAGGTRDPKMRLEVVNRFGSPVPDSRSKLASLDPSGSRRPSLVEAPISLKSHDFDLRMRFFEEDGMKVATVFRLPLRVLSATTSSLEHAGAEIGGFDGGLEIRMAEHLTLETLYSDRRSGKLLLHEPHSDFLASLSFYDGRINADRGFALQARLGADITTPLGQSTLSERVVGDRGFTWGLRARLGGRVEFSPAADFRFGAEALFRRVTSYRVGSVERGGAGLFAIEPYLEYGMSEFLNLRISMAMPLVRPEGREDVFGRPELPGLYGRAFGASISVGFL